MKFKDIVTDQFKVAFEKFIKAEFDFKNMKESLKFSDKIKKVSDEQEKYHKKMSQIQKQFNEEILILKTEYKIEDSHDCNLQAQVLKANPELDLKIFRKNTERDKAMEDLIYADCDLEPLFSIKSIKENMKLTKIDFFCLLPLFVDKPETSEEE